ncbi:sigma-70 family RNA polymerase sigma factor [Anaerotignum sp.]|uniref:sigma-70 family RNA polymerase sigma factor n=1 Tax=Anaerotignum sp. TaxID=2039241 RepID=UPI0028964E90|nr:sigma-70 family RNA polymerase sigma factor [Anaerotignum sp.]
MPFYVAITNSQGKEIRVKVSFEIYELFEEERKEIERLRKEKERHSSDEDVESDIAGFLHSLRTASLEERAMQRQELKSAVDVIKSCTSVQQRRFYFNRILGYTFTEIAAKEHCSERAVKFSVDAVIKKLDDLKNSL